MLEENDGFTHPVVLFCAFLFSNYVLFHSDSSESSCGHTDGDLIMASAASNKTEMNTDQ